MVAKNEAVTQYSYRSLSVFRVVLRWKFAFWHGYYPGTFGGSAYIGTKHPFAHGSGQSLICSVESNNMLLLVRGSWKNEH